MIKSESEMWFVRFEVSAECADEYLSTNPSAAMGGNRYLVLPGTVTKEAVEEAIHDALDRCVREVTVQIGTAVPCKPDWSPEAAHAKPATGGGTSEA